MEKWQWISLILCIFGLLKEFRPSEPFVTEYLIQHKNFTKSTIVQVAYPIATYTYLGALPIVFLITDFLRYKSIVILEGVAFVLTYTLLIWGHGLTNLKVVEVLYGISQATEVAYYTYIYAKVDRECYKKVTSYTYTAILIGNFLAAAISQFLVSSEWMDFHQLNYLTLGSVAMALIIACFLPSVNQSIYFYRKDELPVGSSSEISKQAIYENLTFKQRVQRAYRMLWYDFTRAYSNPYVVKWSIWWAFASAGFLQVISYIQPLYKTVHAFTDGAIYNGAVDAVHTILSATIALLVGYVTLPWRKWGESLLFVISMIQGVLLIVMSQTGSIFVVYYCYIAFRTFYQVMITVATAEVAQGISNDSYGLIFGTNRFISLLLQSIITLVVNDKNGFALDERPQFLTYGIYFCVLGLLFGSNALVTLRNFQSSESSLNQAEDAISKKSKDGSDLLSVNAINELS